MSLIKSELLRNGMWRVGRTLSEIGRELGKRPASIFEVLRTNGGMSPRILCRSQTHFSLEEREEIAIGLASGDSYRKIASRIGKAASSICREVNRQGGRAAYRAIECKKLISICTLGALT
ncbi:MAG: helix-turn-helix domain-containing protein [Oligoflexus sp.]